MKTYQLKLKTFVYCNHARKHSNHWVRHRRMYKYVCSASRETLTPVFCSYQLCLCQCWELRVSVSWASYYVLSSVRTLPKVWSSFPLRCMWVLISPQPDILRIWSSTAWCQNPSIADNRHGLWGVLNHLSKAGSSLTFYRVTVTLGT